MSNLSRFNIRVYGLWIHDQHGVLISSEVVDGISIIKYPGGGLEYGEGPADCLLREWKEELGFEVEITDQFYFTDMLVPSFRNDGDQVISLYYRVAPKQANSFQVHPDGNLEISIDSEERFYFRPVQELAPEHFTFPIDQHVTHLLKEYANSFHK